MLEAVAAENDKDTVSEAWKEWDTEKLVDHFIALAKAKKHKGIVMRSLEGLSKWNTATNSELSSRVNVVIDYLKKDKRWIEINEDKNC